MSQGAPTRPDRGARRQPVQLGAAVVGPLFCWFADMAQWAVHESSALLLGLFQVSILHNTVLLRRYVLVVAGLLAMLLLAFLASEALGVPLLTDPTPAMGGATPAAAAVGAGLLLADVLLPVPGQCIMIGHGHLFGALADAKPIPEAAWMEPSAPRTSSAAGSG
jgi:hypothetical protein